MIEWKYLYSEPFKSRCVLAAHYLRDCLVVVEVGGYKTPISGFLKSGQKAIVIDPRIEPFKSENIEHFQLGFQDWDGIVEKPYGVLILGIELHMDEDGWQKLYNLINGSKLAVIEVPIEHCHSVEQFKKICQNTNKKLEMRVLLDLSGNNFGDMSDSAPPKTLRQMNVLR